ncbi:MAG: DUF4339 domain-containing protein [Sedimentisphaerales bacterium]|nr:DUF4339 domain-containing protein [Sedimentisphaerales bacterium]
MDKDYFFGSDNQTIGPVNLESVKEKISQGVITSQTLIWYEGMDNWKPAGQVQELSSLFKSGIQPPPLPQSPTTPPPLPGTNIPEGLNPFEEKAYRFATAIYRPWRGKDSQLGAYVRKNPKSAVYVSLGTIAVMIVILVLFAYTFSPDKDQGQQYTQGQQQIPMGQMPPVGWQAGHRAMMDAQREIGEIGIDVYTYQRDRQDEMDDFRRKATYGTDN